MSSDATSLCLSLVLLTLAAGGCGGSVATTGSDASTDASADVVDGKPSRAPTNHRPSAITCDPSPASTTGCGITGGPPGSCKADSDCTKGTNGHCVNDPSGDIPVCTCFYDTCKSDADCSTGGPCACHGSPMALPTNYCAPSGNCKIDADCGPGGYCSPSGGAGCNNGLSGYFCHTPTDECLDDADCGSSKSCHYDTKSSHWACVVIPLCG